MANRAHARAMECLPQKDLSLMPILSSSLTECSKCGTQTNTVMTHTQDDCVKVRRYKCPKCGHIAFSAEVMISKDHIYCNKKYLLKSNKIRQLIYAAHA